MDRRHLSSLDMRRRILLIAFVAAVLGVVAAALVWQLWWPSDQPPSGPPLAKRYGSPLGLSSDLYRLRGVCQHPQELITHSRFYLCQFGGEDLFLIVWTQRMVEKVAGQVPYDAENRFDEFFKPFFEDIHGDLRDLDSGGFRDLACSLGLRGVVVGPNWMALSDQRVTLQGVRLTIGGELFTVDPSSPCPAPTESH